MKKDKTLPAFTREINLFFLALTFLTRIPGPRGMTFSPEALNKSSRYFTLTGLIVGAISALFFILCSMVLPHSLSILMSMIITIWLTGAFHEDGFADVCDAFGGGYSKEQILTIMKDSRIGTYGTVGLVLILACKYLCLFNLDRSITPFAIIAGHSISRFASTSVIFIYEYVREDALAKVKPLAMKMDMTGLLMNGLFGIATILFLGNWLYVLLIIPVIIAMLTTAEYFKRKIGGYTGDCLGAVQQITEVVFYLGLIMSFR